jgi:hypothetical protein
MARCGNHFHTVGVDKPAAFYRNIDMRMPADRVDFCSGGMQLRTESVTDARQQRARFVEM